MTALAFIAKRAIVVALVWLVVVLIVTAALYAHSYAAPACYVTEADQTFAGACLDFDAWGWLGGAA